MTGFLLGSTDGGPRGRWEPRGGKKGPVPRCLLPVPDGGGPAAGRSPAVTVHSWRRWSWPAGLPHFHRTSFASKIAAPSARCPFQTFVSRLREVLPSPEAPVPAARCPRLRGLTPSSASRFSKPLLCSPALRVLAASLGYHLCHLFSILLTTLDIQPFLLK